MAQSEKKTAKRPGPRPRGPYVGKRKTLTTRITEETRAGLEAAAAASDRSLSQEIEFRLEQSLSQQEAEVQSWGGGAARETWRACAAASSALAVKNNRDWLTDPKTFQQVQHLTAMLLDLLGAKSPVHAEDLINPATRMVAAYTLRVIADQIDGRGLPEALSYDEELDPSVIKATRKILKNHLD